MNHTKLPLLTDVSRVAALASAKTGIAAVYSAASNFLLERGERRSLLPSYWMASKNFGDALAPSICQLISGQVPILTPEFSGARYRRVVLQGSILERSQSRDVIAGAGLQYPDALRLPDSTRVIVVRGPRTAALLRGPEAPTALGDPAQLMSRLVPRWVEPTAGTVGVVRHYVDRSIPRIDDPSVRYIDVLAPPSQVTSEILQCEIIISSSLHGIIVAESYGIPSIWISSSNELAGGNHKFLDYFEATDRDPPHRAAEAEALRTLRTLPPPRFDADLLHRELARAYSLSSA